MNNNEYLLAATATGCYITVSTDIEIDVYQDSQLITRIRDHDSAKIKIQPYLEYTFIPQSLGMFTFEIAHGTFNQEGLRDSLIKLRYELAVNDTFKEVA